jgi:hypothetical protein
VRIWKPLLKIVFSKTLEKVEAMPGWSEIELPKRSPWSWSRHRRSALAWSTFATGAGKARRSTRPPSHGSVSLARD